MLTTIEKMLFLGSVDLFKDISLEDQLFIAGIAKERSYPAKTVLFREGDEGDSLYLIVKGSVAVTRGEDDKRETIATLETNQCLGEMAILSEESRTATVETIDETECLVIDKASFRALIGKQPELAFQIFNVLVTRLKGAPRKSFNSVTPDKDTPDKEPSTA